MGKTCRFCKGGYKDDENDKAIKIPLIGGEGPGGVSKELVEERISYDGLMD